MRILLNLIGTNKYYLDTFNTMRHIIINIISVVKEVHMAKPQPGNPKEKFLRESGALNTHPVNDALFKDGHFFDPQDLVQVKYEMIRKVTKESEPVSQAAASFGFSRTAFYKLMAEFEQEGIMGLLPRKHGPRGRHKLTDEILEFVKDLRVAEQPLTISAILLEVESRFGVRLHRRSIERALKDEKKTAQRNKNR